MGCVKWSSIARYGLPADLDSPWCMSNEICIICIICMTCITCVRRNAVLARASKEELFGERHFFLKGPLDYAPGTTIYSNYETTTETTTYHGTFAAPHNRPGIVQSWPQRGQRNRFCTRWTPLDNRSRWL